MIWCSILSHSSFSVFLCLFCCFLFPCTFFVVVCCILVQRSIEIRLNHHAHDFCASCTYLFGWLPRIRSNHILTYLAILANIWMINRGFEDEDWSFKRKFIEGDLDDECSTFEGGVVGASECYCPLCISNFRHDKVLSTQLGDLFLKSLGSHTIKNCL